MSEIRVLLEALRSSVQVVRDAALRALSEMKSAIITVIEDHFDETFYISKQIWITKFDIVEENR